VEGSGIFDVASPAKLPAPADIAFVNSALNDSSDESIARRYMNRAILFPISCSRLGRTR
jgi:hypothetical protein